MNIWDYDNYIFDLYGTLIDIRTDEHSAGSWKKWCKWLDANSYKHPEYTRMRREFFNADAAARKKALAEWGFEVPEIDVVPIYKEMFIGYGNKAGQCTQEKLELLSYAFRKSSCEYIRLYPGVEAFLKALHDKGKKVFILSNAQRSYTWPEICMFNLHNLTDDILISSDCRCMKPDKAFFDILINKHKLDRTRSLMLGDNANSDILGASRSGLSAIHLAGDKNSSKFYVDNLKLS